MNGITDNFDVVRMAFSENRRPGFITALTSEHVFESRDRQAR